MIVRLAISTDFIERQRTEAEEAQRLVAFTLNASAGVAMCRGSAAAAVRHYREVLRLEAAGLDGGLGLRLDSLQRLHALHNLQLAMEAATAGPGGGAGGGARGLGGEGNGAGGQAGAGAVVGVSRTLRDATLGADADTEREKYLAHRAGGGGAAATDLLKSTKAVEDARRRCGARGRGAAGCAWWSAVVDAAATSADRGRALLDRVVDGTAF